MVMKFRNTAVAVVVAVDFPLLDAPIRKTVNPDELVAAKGV